MKKFALPFAALFFAGCNSADTPPGLTTSDYQELQRKAVANAGCVIEDQFACTHVIENRQLLSSFFSPEGLGGKDESEKLRGRRVTTKYVVDAVSAIKQCRKTDSEAIPLLKKLEISDGQYQVLATIPVSATSSCYMIPDVESS